MSPAEEKAAFERLIDFIIERRAHDPGMHVYHYAPYEPTAMKRLMGRYATQADELDDSCVPRSSSISIRIVRMALRAGVDSYSIKRARAVLWARARSRSAARVSTSASRRVRDREEGFGLATLKTFATPSASYNRDDCISALGLRDWLERLRAEEEARRGEPLPRPAPPS